MASVVRMGRYDAPPAAYLNDATRRSRAGRLVVRAGTCSSQQPVWSGVLTDSDTGVQ